MSSHLLIRPSHLFIRQQSVRKSLETHVPGFLKARELCLFSSVNSHIYKKCNTHSLWVSAANEYLKSNLRSEKIVELKKAYQFEKIPLERLKRIATGYSVQIYSKVSFEKGLDKADLMVNSPLGSAFLRKTAQAAPLIGCASGFLTACILGTPSLREKISLPVSPSLILKAMGVSLAIQMLFRPAFPLGRGMITQVSQTITRAFLSSIPGLAITLVGAVPLSIICLLKRSVIAQINRRGDFEGLDWPLAHAIYNILPEERTIEACILALFVKIFTPIYPQAIPFNMPIPVNILARISAASAPTSWYLLGKTRLNHSQYTSKQLSEEFVVNSSLATIVGVLAYMAANQAETLVPRVLRYNLSTLSVVTDACPHILSRGITEVKQNKVSTALDAVVVSVAMVALVGSGAASALTLGVSVACALKCSRRAIVPRSIVRSIALVGSRIVTRVFSRIFGNAPAIAQ